LFSHLNRGQDAPVKGMVPECTAASTGEQPELPLAHSLAQNFQHLQRITTRQPLRLGHFFHSFATFSAARSTRSTLPPRILCTSSFVWPRLSNSCVMYG